MDNKENKQIKQEVDRHNAAQEILILLGDAHANAAEKNRGNISSTAVLIAFQGSGSVLQAVSSGILSTGSVHAPVETCRNLVAGFMADQNATRDYLEHLVKSNHKIPGLGNSFFKEGIDPSFQSVYEMYVKYAGPGNPVDRITHMSNFILSEHKGKEVQLYPNAALITAAICHLLQMPRYFEIQIFIESRLPVWLSMLK